MHIHTRQWWGMHLLRLSLAGVFLWFGFSQLTNGLQWVSFVPDWAVSLFHIPPAMIVLANGAFEVILGTLLALGFFVRITAFLLGLHLFFISLSLGSSALAVRDFGLSLSSLALSLLYVKDVVFRPNLNSSPSSTSTYKSPEIYPHITNDKK